MKLKIFLGVFVMALMAGGIAWALSASGVPVTRALQPAFQTASFQPQAPSISLDDLDKLQLQTLITNSGQNAIKSAIQQVAPAVVQIDVTRSVDMKNTFNQEGVFEYFLNDPKGNFEDLFDRIPQSRERVTQSLGSGVFIEFEEQVYLISNYHVVKGAESLQVTTQNGDRFNAQVIGSDTTMDIAILNVDTQGQAVPVARLGNSNQIEIGDWAVAIGNPLGLSHTVTAGIISAVERSVNHPEGNGRFRALIQTDAAINPGNSGGPLVNALGEVIGINTLIANNAEGLNFAININQVKQALPQLIQEGHVSRAWLGVFIQELDNVLAQQFGISDGAGVLISDVVPDAPAMDALQSGDVLQSVDGQVVNTVAELQDAIMFKTAGEIVTLNIIRDGQPVTVEVTLGQRPDEGQTTPAQHPQTQEPDVEALQKFGLKVRVLTPEKAEALGLNSDAQQLIIEYVEPNSRAFWASPQPQPGDVIAQLNRQDIATIEAWNKTISELDDRADVVLTLIRDGRTFFIALP